MRSNWLVAAGVTTYNAEGAEVFFGWVRGVMGVRADPDVVSSWNPTEEPLRSLRLFVVTGSREVVSCRKFNGV